MDMLPALALALFLQAATTARDLVERLGADEAPERERAAAALAERGEEAVPDLLRALDHPDAEVALRSGEVLRRIGVSKWLPRWMDDRRALDFFHHAHHDIFDERSRERLVALTSGGFAMRLDSTMGLVVFRLGGLRRVRAEDLTFTGNGFICRAPGAPPIEFRWNEGAIVAAFSGELDAEPLCRQLWRRVLEEPADPQAACLLADLVDAPLEATLLRWLETDDRRGAAAFEILTNHWAKSRRWAPTPAYFARLERRLETAGWELVAPVAALAALHPTEFLPALAAGWASSNRWRQYLTLGMARVTRREALYHPRILEFLESPHPDFRREAVVAALALAPDEALPAGTLVKVAAEYNPPETFIVSFLERKDPRLGIELARRAGTAPGLVIAAMGPYADVDPAVAAFCESLPADLDGVHAYRLVPLLGRMAEAGRQPAPIEKLRGFLRFRDPDLADVALRAYVSAAGSGSSEEIERLLVSTFVEYRRRGVEGIYALWLLSASDDVLRARLGARLGRFADHEPDAAVGRLAIRYHAVMTGRGAIVLPDIREPQLPRLTRCIGTGDVGGWKPVIQAPIARPNWSD